MKTSDGWRFTKATTEGKHYVQVSVKKKCNKCGACVFLNPYLIFFLPQGGVHLSNPSFLPNALLKELTATTNTLNLTKFFNLNHNWEQLDKQQELLHS